MTRPLQPKIYRKQKRIQRLITIVGLAFKQVFKNASGNANAATQRSGGVLQFIKVIAAALIFFVAFAQTIHAQSFNYSLNPGSHVNVAGTNSLGSSNGWSSYNINDANPSYTGDENVSGLHVYSSQGNGGTVAYNTLNENGSGGTARTLKPGDRILIGLQTGQNYNSGENPLAGGTIGVSFNNNTTYSNTTNITTNQVCKFELGQSSVNSGAWSVFSGAGLATVNTNTSAVSNAAGTGFAAGTREIWLEIDITSSNTFDATIYSSYTGTGTGGTYQKYCNLSFGSAGPISSFCVYNLGHTTGTSNSNPDLWVEQITESGIDNTGINNTANAQPDVAAITLENLEGASSAAGTISGVISNGSNANSTTTATTVLTMGGTGTVTLSGANTYTGLTTIKSGTLQLGAANVIPANGVTLSGGTLSSGATTGFGNTSMGALSMTSSSAISLGTGAHTLTFSALGGTWTGTLTVNGWTGTVSASGTAGKIFIGASSTLTAGQLSQFSFTGYSGAVQLATGEVVPTAVLTPTVVLANNSGGQVSAGNIAQSSTSDIIYNFQTAVTTTVATLNSVAFTTTGTATSGTDITNFKLWYTSGSTFTSPTLLSTLTTTLGAGTHTFGSLTQAVSSGTTGYFWVTADIPIGATIGHTIIGSALTTANLTYSVAPSISGSTSAGGTQTVSAAVPVIVLADNSGGQVAAGNMVQGSTSNIVYNFQTAVTTAAATLNQVVFTTTGTATSGTDITNFKLWYTSGSTFSSPTLLSTLTTSLGAGTHTFGSLSQTVASGATGYFWVTADIPSGATLNNTIIGSAITTGNLTFASGSLSGSTSAGGTQTIKNLYFRSLATGVWSTPGNWQSSPDNATWSTATVYPQAGANTVTIQSPHTITMDVSPGNLANNVTINSGGTLSLNNGTTLAISAGTLTVNGTLNVQTGAVVSGAGTFTLPNSSTATLGIGDANGITTSGATGSIQTTTRNYGAGATYSYIGTVNQVTGNGLPSTIGALTINNSGSSGNNVVTLTTSGTIIEYNLGGGSTGILTLSAGVFEIGSSNNITFNNNSGNNTTFGITNNGGNFATTGPNGADGGTLIIPPGSGYQFNFNGTGVTTFYNITVGTGVGSGNVKIFETNPKTVIIDGQLTLQDQQSQWNTNAPLYTSNSVLSVNNTGSQYSPGSSGNRLEWAQIAPGAGTIGVTAGYPNNVILMNMGTSASNYNSGLPNNSGNTQYGVKLSGAWSINGYLQIGTSSVAGAVDMDNGGSAPHTNSFSCGGLILANTSSAFAAPDTMRVYGNWFRTSGSKFGNNSGKVIFAGGGTCSLPNSVAASGTTESFYNLVDSNSTFLSLGSPVNVTNTLNLISGVITPTSTNTLNVTNTAITAITGGGASTYINGPVNWTLLSSGTNSYVFPVGVATCPSTNAYLPFTLSSKNTSSGNIATVQAFATGSGGTPDGSSITYLDSAVYWSLSTSTSLTTTGSTVSLSEPTAISPYNVIAKSSSAMGSYSSLNGTAGANGVTGSDDIGTASPLYFGFGVKYVAGTITTGTISGSPLCNGAAVSVPYTFTGTPLNNVTFTAQLSDASGSFASPTTIGTASSGSSGSGTISATLPASIASGAGYLIRVISTSPVVTGSSNSSGAFTITGQTISLSSGSNAQSVCPSSAITSIVYAIGGTSTATTISWSSVPAGITFTAGTHTISGTPTVSGVYTYTVSTSGSSCNPATATGTITVGQALALTSAVGTDNQTVCQNTTITNITYSTGAATGASLAWSPSTPAGITGSYSSGVYTISGTVTANAGTYTYTVTTSGACGSAATKTGTIIVDGAPAVYSYPAGPSLLYLFTSSSLANSGVDNWGVAVNPGGASATSDRFGNTSSAYSFTGSSSSNMYNGTGFTPSYSTISEGVWFKTTTAGGVLMGLSSTQGATGVSYDHTLYMDNSGFIYYGIYNGSRHPLAEAIDKSYADGNWHLAVGTMANDGEKLYVDGVLKGTNSNNYAQSGGEVYAVIGGNNLNGWGAPADSDNVPTNFYYTGTLDDPIIYNGTELNATQVFDMYSTANIQETSNSCTGATISMQSFTLGTGTYTVTYSVSGTNTVSSTSATMSFTAGSPGTGTFTTTSLVTAGTNNVVNVTALTGSDGCSSNITLNTVPFTTSGGAGYTWTGAVDSNWSVAGNWSCGVPTSTSDVTIPYVGPTHKEPILSSSDTVHSINLSSSSSTVGINGHTFTINGTASGTGTFSGSGTSSMAFGGSATGTVNFTSSADTLQNITLSNGANITIGNTLMVASTGTVTVGTTAAATLVSNNNITLVSDNNGSARVAAVPVSGGLSLSTITGNVNVQAYFHSSNSSIAGAHRAWRLITAPITNKSASPVSSIYSSWQNGGVFAAGIGTRITVPVAALGTSTDMDAGINSNYSGYTWNVGSQQLVTMTDDSKNISGTNGTADNIGYFIFVRGDRTPSTVNPPYLAYLDNTTLSATGPLQLGDQAFSLSGTAAKLSLVGNPYACSISFSSLFSGGGLSNVYNRYYLWNANIPGAEQVGGYITMDGTGGGGTYVNSYTGTNTSTDINLQIQSGQAFFVQTIATAAASITFKETYKTLGTANNNYIYRPEDAQSSTANEFFYTGLSSINSDSSISLIDGTVAQYGNFCDCVDGYDAPKFTNIDEMLSLSRNGKKISIERRPTIVNSDTLFITLNQMAQQGYQFKLAPTLGSHPGLGAHLEDSYTGIHTPLNLADTNKVNFTIDGNAASKVQNRFMVVFGAVNIAPVYTGIRATREGNTVLVQWSVSNDQDMTGYVLQRSTDGINYVTVYTTVAQHTTGQYSWVDTNPVAGTNYYRVISTDILNEQSYSSVVSVTFSSLSPSGIVLYPNPIKEGVIGLAFNNMPAGEYHYRLLDEIGQVLQEGSINHPGGNATDNISITNPISRGTYQLEIFLPDNTKTTLSFVY